MYLYDQVAQCVAQAMVADPAGRVHRVPGAADLADAVRDCGIRYVLDDAVRDTCLEILCERPDVLNPADPCYRIPHRALWVEWVDPVASRGVHQRAGILVLADETGRRGTMQSFSHDPGGMPWTAQVFYDFDFDREISHEPLPGGAFAGVRDPEALLRLYRHGAGRVDDRWIGFLRDAGALDRATVHRLVRAAAPDFGLLCAFLLLLDLDCADARPRDGLARINRARARTGKPLLLDHLEVGMRLAPVAHNDDHAGGGDSREAPRLHQVRGHLVRRDGKTFWRANHLRGDAARGVVASRTVHVMGDRRQLRQGIRAP